MAKEYGEKRAKGAMKKSSRSKQFQNSTQKSSPCTRVFLMRISWKRGCVSYGGRSFASPISRIIYYLFRSSIIYLHTLFLAVKVRHNFLKMAVKAIQNSWAASKKLKKFFRGSRKQMSPDSRAGNLQKDLEVHVCHVSEVNRKLEVGPRP